jgi:hypothetical protein
VMFLPDSCRHRGDLRKEETERNAYEFFNPAAQISARRFA